MLKARTDAHASPHEIHPTTRQPHPTKSTQEIKRVLQIQGQDYKRNKPEVVTVLGKAGRANTATVSFSHKHDRND